MKGKEAIEVMKKCLPIWIHGQDETVEQLRLAMEEAIKALECMERLTSVKELTVLITNITDEVGYFDPYKIAKGLSKIKGDM